MNARIRRLLEAGDMNDRAIATACRVTVWRVREVRRQLAEATEPPGIARVRAEVAELERQERDDGPDRTRALLLDAKRRTLALLLRVAADTPPAA